MRKLKSCSPTWPLPVCSTVGVGLRAAGVTVGTGVVTVTVAGGIEGGIAASGTFRKEKHRMRERKREK